MVGYVSQFEVSQSYGRDRLPESAIFFLCFFFFEMQKNFSQAKNEKSTGRKTWPTLMDKMAMLKEIYAGVNRCLSVHAAVSWPINQSINQSNYQSNYQSINRSNYQSNYHQLKNAAWMQSFFKVLPGSTVCYRHKVRIIEDWTRKSLAQPGICRGCRRGRDVNDWSIHWFIDLLYCWLPVLSEKNIPLFSSENPSNRARSRSKA